MENGNPISYYNGYRYTLEWEHGRQLKSMTYLGNTVSYEYDANGIRTKKINPTGMCTDYYVVDGKAIGEVVKHTDGTVKYWLRYLFDESGQIIGYSYWALGDTSWSEYYFAKNLQGDVVGVYRASDNAQVAFYEYDAWGNILYKYGDMADINPFRYRTYYYDNETWFYYLQSRYYDPAIGRFINADALVSTGQGLLGNNMFAYCLNNPVNMADYNGEDAIYVVDYKAGRGLPVVGHAYAYIQDEDGNWYKTQFEGVFPNKSTAVITCQIVVDTTEIDQMVQGKSISNINYVYISGDFTDSLEYALQYDGTNYGGYHFTQNNCMHYVQDTLLEGTFSNKLERETMFRYHEGIPTALYSQMKTTQRINKFGGVIKDAWRKIQTLF